MRHVDSDQAVITELLASTDKQRPGARIYACCADGDLLLEFDPSLTKRENHGIAAQILCEELGWQGRFIAASLPEDRYCFVSITDKTGEIPAFVC